MRTWVALLLVSGCSTQVVPPSQREGMERALLAEIAANQARVCKRPVLRGTPSPGRADEDLLAVVAPKPDQPMAGCMAALWKDSQRKLADHEKYAVLDETVDQCAALPDAIERAIAHEDACSPWLAGRRSLSDPIAIFRLTRVVVRLIERSNRAHDVERGAKLLSGWLRLVTDLHRGESTDGGRAVSLVSAMVDSAGAPMTVLQVLPALGETRPEVAAQLGTDLDVIERSRPTFDQTLAARYDVVQLWYRATKPDGWVPPWGLAGFDDNDVPHSPTPRGIDASDAAYIGWLAQEKVGQRLVEACPATSDLAHCRAAMDRVAAELAKAEQPSAPSMWFAWIDRASMQRRMVDALVGQSADAFGKYANRYWQGAFVLRALRLWAWIAAHREPDGRCAQLATIEKEAGDGRIDPANGKPFVVTVTDGKYHIDHAAAPELETYPDPEHMHLDFRCAPQPTP